MKRIIFLASVLAAMLILSIGCSDDSTPAGNDLLVGDTNSAEFQFVGELFGDGEIESAFRVLELSFDFLDSAGVFQSPMKNRPVSRASGTTNEVITYSLTKSYVNGWHIFSFQGLMVDTIYNDTVSFGGIDSVQIRTMGAPIAVNDSTFDEIYIRAHYTYTEVGVGAGSSDLSMNLTNFVEDTLSGGMGFTINGTTTETIDALETDSNTTCDYAATSTITITNLVFSASGDCPSGGSMSLVADLDLTCIVSLGTSVDTISVSGLWNFSVTFNSDNTSTYSFNDGTTEWTGVDTCYTDGVQASPYIFHH